MSVLLIDAVGLSAALLALLSWWKRDAGWARVLLVPSSVLALAAAVAGLLDARWQLALLAALALVLLLSALIVRIRARPSERLPWITGTIFGLAFLAAVGLLYLYPATDLPEPSGPHPVGVRDFMLIDESRPGLLAASADEPRKLLVRVWYPAAGVQGLARRAYFTDREAETTATGLGRLAGAPFYFTYLKHVRTNSYGNAPLIQAGESLPVVFYSHGYTSFAGQNTALMEELASHGYLVFSVQHTYDASPTLFPDGTVAAMDPALIAQMQAQMEAQEDDGFAAAITAESYRARYEGLLANQRRAVEEGQRIATISADIWLADRLFVHDALAAGRVPPGIASIAAAGDLLRTGQMGMSFGGSTTGAVCMVDVRCAAGVNLDGGDYHLLSWMANIPVPFLMLYSDYRMLYEQLGGDPAGEAHGFNDFSYERPELAGLRDDVVRLTVRGAAHLGVSDFNLFMRNPVRAPLLGPIDGERMIRIQNDFVRAFFDTHLKGEDLGFPGNQFALHEGWVSPDPVDGVRAWWLDAHPEDRTERVRIETSLGDVDVALYPERAPVSTANFLAYVDGGDYDGASFYRALEPSGEYGYGVIQGGLLGDAMAGDGAEYAEPDRIRPPIRHETTDETGILNERGTLAYARLAPGSAGSEFFFNLTDNAVLDTGADVPGRDGLGYATFGRVLTGMRVLELIQAQPVDGNTGMERLRGQILTDPVRILRVRRIESAD